jgi:hypothetical protein
MTFVARGTKAKFGIWSIAGLALAAASVRFLLYALYAARHGGVADGFCHWDCGWYLDIIHTGYAAEPSENPPRFDEANWAFFPLYPLLARALAWITRLPGPDAAILLSFLATTGFLIVSSLYLQRTRANFSVPLWMGFALAYPYSLYLSFPLSESLYLLLATMALLALCADRPYPGAAFAALASAARPVGVLFAPIFAAKGLLALRKGLSLGRAADALLPVLIAPLGLFVFSAFLYWRMGDALAFSHVQSAWDRHLSLYTLLKAAQHWDFANMPARQSATFNLLLGMAGLGISAFLAWRRRFMEAWLCGASILLPLVTGTDSMQRFTAGTPVFLFGLFDLLCAGRPLPLAGAVLALFGGAQILLLHYWFSGAAFLA